MCHRNQILRPFITKTGILKTMKQLNYYKLEQRDSFDMKKTRTVYRIKNRGLSSGEQFIEEVEHRCSMKASLIKAVLMEVKDELEELLGLGYAVTLPGIGAFSLGVRLNEDRKRQLEMENAEAEAAAHQGSKPKRVAEPNSALLELHHINFRKDKDFFGNVKKEFNQLTLKRLGGKRGSRITIDDQSQNTRIELALSFLRSHPFMRVSDYAQITGLSRSSAQRELVEIVQNGGYGITITGRGSHRVYVLQA